MKLRIIADMAEEAVVEAASQVGMASSMISMARAMLNQEPLEQIHIEQAKDLLDRAAKNLGEFMDAE